MFVMVSKIVQMVRMKSFAQEQPVSMLGNSFRKHAHSILILLKL